MQQIIRPLQISFIKQVVEQNNEFHFIITAILGFDLCSGQTLLEMDYLEKAFSAMGDNPLPDMGFAKIQAEYLVSGSYYAKNAQAQESDLVKVQIGPHTKQLQVFAPRQWQQGLPKLTGTITHLPLTYQLAYGGNTLATNPSGIGYQQQDLPQIELAGQGITSNQQQSLPAGFGPIEQTWPQRSQFQGTYDDAYLQESFPGFAKDMDWRWFNCAPADQQFSDFFIGDEYYQFSNLHPQKNSIAGQLPNLRCRSFVQKKGEISELDMHLDTLWFFPDQELGLMYFRSMLKVADIEGREIEHILLAYEQIDQPRDLPYYQACLQKRLQQEDALLNLFNTQDLIANGHLSAMRQLQLQALENTTSSAFEDNLQAKMQQTKQLVDEQLQQVQTSATEVTDSKALAEQQKIMQQIEQASQADASIDTDQQQLNEQLEAIIPGITSGDLQQLDLSHFSFKDIDRIMQAVDAFTQKKSTMAQTMVNEQSQQLEQNSQDQLKQMLQDGMAVSNDQQQALQQQIEQCLQPEETAATAILSRLNVTQLQQGQQQLEPEIEQALQSMQMQSSSEGADSSEHGQEQGQPQATADFQDNITQLQALLKVDNQDNSQQQQLVHDFFTTYRNVAHFQEQAQPAHTQPLDTVKQSLIRLIQQQQAINQQDWACVDLSGMRLQDLDFSDCYLEQVDFTDCKLLRCNFSGAILSRSIFKNSHCEACCFTDSNVGAIMAQNAQFIDCDFSNSQLSKSDFTGASFNQCNFTEVESLELSINRCQFHHCQLPQLKLIERNMSEVQFFHCKLSEASFVTCQWIDCLFQDSDCYKITWANCYLEHCQFTNNEQSKNCWASLDSHHYFLKDCIFTQCQLPASNFQAMQLQTCQFLQCNLSQCNFNDADAKRCKFTDSDLQESQFRYASLQQSDFNKVNLMQGSLAQANLQQSDFQQANLYAVDFLRCTLGNTNFLHANLDCTLIEDWRPSA